MTIARMSTEIGTGPSEPCPITLKSPKPVTRRSTRIKEHCAACDGRHANVMMNDGMRKKVIERKPFTMPVTMPTATPRDDRGEMTLPVMAHYARGDDTHRAREQIPAIRRYVPE